MKKLRGLIILLICAGLCIGYYCYLSYGTSDKEEQPEEMARLISKDLDKSYPTTPREVIKLYNRILFCLYNEKPKEEEIDSLGEQARKLFDEELLTQNPEDIYLANLKAEVKAFEKDKKKIMSSVISASKDVERRTVNGYECAYVESSYYVKGKKDSERAGQMYILRKDEEGRWKILGYYRP